jgi:site-specific recombinase XerD
MNNQLPSSPEELLALLSQAQELVRQRAAKKTKKRTQSKRAPVSLTDAEILKVLGLAAGKRLRDVVLFCLTYRHGLRASEALNIRRRDLQNGYIRVRRGKGSEETEHRLLGHDNPLLNEIDLAERWLAEMGDRGKKGAAKPGGRRSRDRILLFTQKVKSCQADDEERLFPFTRQRYFQLFREYAAAAGLAKRKQHPHCLKHTIATKLLRDGAPPNALKEWLGWKSMRTADHYTRLNADEVASLVDQITRKTDTFRPVQQGKLFND